MTVDINIQLKAIFPLIFIQFQSKAQTFFDNCVYDACSDLESGEDGQQSACDEIDAFNEFLMERGHPGVNYWSGDNTCGKKLFIVTLYILLDFLLTAKAAHHECVIRTSQPLA